jgi:PAS domain S-box-containing protein
MALSRCESAILRRDRRSAGIAAPTVVALIWLGFAPACATPSLAAPLDTWRSEAARIRVLAENDAPNAYEAAQRLQANLPADATPADRARALNLLSRIETYLALTEPAAAHARAAFDLAAKSDDRIGQAESDLNVALNAINQGRLDDMVAAVQHSVTVLEGVDRPDLVSEAMLRTTVMYRRFEQFDESVAVAVQAMEIAQRSNNPLALAYAHQGLAIAFDQSYSAAEAHEHAQQMRVQARAANSRLLEAYAVAGLAGTKIASGDFGGAEKSLREATEMYREVGAPFAISFGLFGLADILAKQKRYQEAILQLNEALAIYERFPNRIGQWFTLNARSADYQALGNVATASADAERAYTVAKDLGIAIYLSGSATRLASIAAAKGDYGRAYALSREASEMTERAARQKAGERMVQLIKRNESQSTQRQIDELTRRSEQQDAQILQRELEQRWLWTLLASVVAALIGAALFVARVRHSQRQLQALNAQLQLSENDIRALNASLEQRVQARTLELHRQALYLRTLIDMLPMWAWFKDTQSRYLVVNQALAEARGLTMEVMVGQSDGQLFPAPLAQQQRFDDEEVMASRQRKTTEERVGDDGAGAWMETYKAAVLDEDGAVLGMVGVARNVSERKAAEAAREAALSEARQLARQRSDFLAQMSHELRTPLNAIMGFAQILQRDRTLTDRQTRALKIIDESGRHLLTLINDILDLARVDAAKLELHPVEINLQVFLQLICDTIQIKAEEKSLLLTFHAASDLPATVRVDDNRLRQVLLNLLSNAVKFSDSGLITLHVTCRAPPAAKIQTMTRLRFEVADGGIGMSAEQILRLFQPFEQVSEAGRREGGTGLGLAISRHLVRLMGGDIEVRSRVSEGSVFSFEIDVPASRIHTQVLLQSRAPIGYRGERRKILLVDDVMQNRAILLEELSSLGFQVAEAANGLEALEVAARYQPDLIVMDLTMPVMDGLEATRRLRAIPRNAKLPIVAMSANVTAETEARSRHAGANEFVGKPDQESVLLNVIAGLLHLDWIYDGAAAQRDAAVEQDTVRGVSKIPGAS